LKSVFSVIVILLLLASSVPFELANAQPVLDSTITDSEHSNISSTPEASNAISISLEENVGMKTGQPPDTGTNNYGNTIIDEQLTYQKVILSEKLGISTNLLDQSISIKSYKQQPQTIIERIWQPEKINNDRTI